MKKLTILSVGALLCLLRPKAKRQKLQACLLITLLLCVFNGQLKAQESAALKVGNKLPESFWQQEHTIYQNGTYSKQTLSTYRDSLLILDYWATWCGSCIIKFPELEALQQQYAGKVKILLVNPTSYKDTPAKIEALFTAQLPPYRNYKLPTVITDSLLIKSFSPLQLPQNFWIIGGQLRAITSAEFTNATAIDAVLALSAQVKATKQARKSKASTQPNKN